MSKLEITSDRLATVVAEKVVATLAIALKDYAASGAFPTAEDVERIRDHVSPNGVAFQNGRRSGILGACDLLRTHGQIKAVEILEEALRQGVA